MAKTRSGKERVEHRKPQWRRRTVASIASRKASRSPRFKARVRKAVK